MNMRIAVLCLALLATTDAFAQTPGGGQNAVQRNNAGSFAGDETKFSFDGTNVGIGTSSAPNGRLEIKSGSNVGGGSLTGITLEAPTSDSLVQLAYNSDADWFGLSTTYLSTGTYKNVAVGAGGTANVLLQPSSGNVGIGTWLVNSNLILGRNPASQPNSVSERPAFFIAGIAERAAAGMVIDAYGDGSNGSAGNSWVILRASDDHMGKSTVPGTVGFAPGAISWEAVAGNSTYKRMAYIYSQIASVQSTSVSGNIGFVTTNSSGSGVAAMIIDSAQNVGIGSGAPGARLDVSGSTRLVTAGGKLYIKEGANACMGVSTLSSGTATVSTSCITANSRVSLTLQNCSSCGTVYLGTVTAGTSFVINSSNGADASNVYWQIVDKL